MANYPEWVKQFRKKGQAIKKVGNSYYLYQHTSRRVPGKKYPQAVDTFIGVITPNGVIEKKKNKLTIENIEVYEYGFSFALNSLCPDEWKRLLKTDWQDVLYSIIREISPQSYLLVGYKPKEVSRNIKLQEQKLLEKLSISIESLYSLSTIYLLRFEEKDVISKITDEQKKLLDELGLQIGGVLG